MKNLLNFNYQKIIDLVIFDYKKIKNFIKVIFCLTLIYFFVLFLKDEISLKTFFYLMILFFINYFLFYIYLSSKKELKYIPIYPLIIFYYLATYTFYFYFNYELDPIYGQFFTELYLYPEMTDQGKYVTEKFIYPSIDSLIFTISSGLIFFSLGYFSLNYFQTKKNTSWLKLELDNKIEILLIISFILFIIFYYINLQTDILSLSILVQLKYPILMFLLAYFQIRYLTSNNIFFLLILFLILFFSFIIEIAMGATLYPYFLIIGPILVKFYRTKEINILTISIDFNID